MAASVVAADEASKPPSLPSYSEMIVAAIGALNEKNGSNKSSISKYIESSYAELPPSHSSLLSAHLARMKESGEIIMVKNNYLLPGLDSPPKRGRGRPPKPKARILPGETPPTPRPRGRPPKPRDPLQPHPSKKPRPFLPEKSATALSSVAVKKGRGRPPKEKPQFADVGFA